MSETEAKSSFQQIFHKNEEKQREREGEREILMMKFSINLYRYGLYHFCIR